MESEQQTIQSRSQRRGWLWTIIALLLIGSIAAAVVVGMRMREKSRVREQYMRFVQIGRTIDQYVREHGNLPTRDVLVASTATPEMIRDVATGLPVEYRIVTRNGEQIEYENFGRRPIVWTPQPSYRGNRLVLLNSLELLWIRDRDLDLDEQMLLIEDKLNQSSARLEMEGGDEPNTDE